MNKEKVYIAVIVILAIALIVGYAQKETKSISVSEIVIPKEGLKFKTAEGKVFLMIMADKNGGALGIYDNQGIPVAQMFVSEYGGSLDIANNQGKKVVGMAAGKDGGGLVIANNQEKPVAVMGTLKYDGSLGIFDNQGKHIWSKP